MRSTVWPAAVSMMMPMPYEARSSRVSESPSCSGRFRSMSTTSMRCSCTTLRMASPSPATNTSKPQNSKYSRRVARSSGSSSTTRMLPLSLAMAFPRTGPPSGYPLHPARRRRGRRSPTRQRLAQEAQDVVRQERLLQIRHVRLIQERLDLHRQRVAVDECQPLHHVGALALQRTVEPGSVEHGHAHVAENEVVGRRQGALQAQLAIQRHVRLVAVAAED